MNGQAEIQVVPTERVEKLIVLLRGEKVLLGQQLAELYGVPVKVLIQAVKRNHNRFPKDFMFQLSSEEFEQAGQCRADYGEQLLDRLSTDLSTHFGRGFSVDHCGLMRLFHSTYPLPQLGFDSGLPNLRKTKSVLDSSRLVSFNLIELCE